MAIAIEKPKGLPAPTGDVEQGLANLDAHGITIHTQFLDSARRQLLIERLEEQAEMERRLGLASIGGAAGPQDLLESYPGDDRIPIYQNVEFLPNKGRVFLDLMMDPLARSYASGVLRSYPHKVWSYGGIISRRGLAKQKAHIDQNVIPPELCGEMPAMINMFLCLSDFDADMGATLIAPGSHKWPRPSWSDEDENVDWYPAVAKAGDAIIWEGRTWHRAGPHTSDKTRLALSFTFCLYAVNPQVVYTSVLHDRVYETLTLEELDLLGFTVQSAGYQGRLGPRNPFDTRMNCNRKTLYVPELRRGE